MKHSRRRLMLLFALFCLSAAVACGQENSPELIVSGHVEGRALSENPDKPVLVAVLRHDPQRSVGVPAMEEIVSMVSLDRSDASFRIDLGETGLQPGDAIDLLVFLDLNYTQGLPSPDAGDPVGFYIDTQNFSPAYVLQQGPNADITIHINRVIRPYRTLISGTVADCGAGDILIVAYAGEIDSPDFTQWDIDQVVGFARLSKADGPLAYTIELLPYPEAPQREDLLVAAILDDGHAGIPSPGNLIGFHAGAEGKAPERVAFAADADSQVTGVDIRMRFPDAAGDDTAEIRIPYPSGDDILLCGRYAWPPDFDPDQGAVFMLVARTDDPALIMASPLTTINYFQKMPRGENRFALDLSKTGLSLADDVLVIALWDRDWQTGFPDPTVGDMLGLAQNQQQLSILLPLAVCQGCNELPGCWELSVNKAIYDHEASIQFQMASNFGIVPQAGQRVLVYAVDSQGLQLSPLNVDMDYVVGMRQVTVGADGPPYTFDLLPAIYTGIAVAQEPFGLADLRLVAVLDDTPANGRPDAGEYAGSTLLAFAVVDGLNTIANRIVFPGDLFILPSP